MRPQASPGSSLGSDGMVCKPQTPAIMVEEHEGSDCSTSDSGTNQTGKKSIPKRIAAFLKRGSGAAAPAKSQPPTDGSRFVAFVVYYGIQLCSNSECFLDNGP